MGWLSRKSSRPRTAPEGAADVRPYWSPGPVQVHVVGTGYYAESVARAAQTAQSSPELVGVLVADPSNLHDPNAVAVEVLGEVVGHLPRELAVIVQPALTSALARHGGRLAGHVNVSASGAGGAVVLMIDPAPIGLRPDQFRTVPMLTDGQSVSPAPVTGTSGRSGVNRAARAELAKLDQAREQVDANHDRPKSAWPRLEKQFRDVATLLDRSGDPLAGQAWLGVARSTRYQTGRRADTMAAFAESVRRDPGLVEGWDEMIDYLAWTPDGETLLQVWQSAPRPVRPDLIPTLLLISRGTDRNGRMAPRDGDRLRAQMFAAAESSGDHGSCAALYADAGKQAAKQNDVEGAFEWWRRAVAIGCTEPQVVDRVTTGMVQAGDYAAAASALRASLVRDNVARTTRDRLEKRLARCERALA